MQGSTPCKGAVSKDRYDTANNHEGGAANNGIANMKKAYQDKSNRDVKTHTVGASRVATAVNATGRTGKHPQQDTLMTLVQKYDTRSGALVLRTPNIITYTKLMVSVLHTISTDHDWSLTSFISTESCQR